jgi:hypothetical protein
VPDDGAPGHSWDKCHDLVRRGFGIAGAAAAEFAEPDLEQQWVYTDENRQAMGLVNACAAPEPQNPRYPTAPGEFWMQNAPSSMLRLRKSAIPATGGG